MDDVLEATADAESPTSFFYWSALAAISATVKNRVYLDKGYYKLFPNIYVLLIAKSGLRKGFPVSLAKKLVELVDHTRIISGRSSIQAIVKELSTAKSRKGKPPITDASAFIASGEFSTSIVRDEDALTILTDLYDGHYNETWRNVLKSTGTEELKGVNLTLLGAMNQTHFNDMITGKEIEGGFIARCILVLEEKRAKKNALVRPLDQVFDPTKLAAHLTEIANLSGPFQWSPEAMDMFEDWYMKFEPESKEDKTGTLNRIHDTVLKVAMLVSLAKRYDLTILPDDLSEAMEKTLGRSNAVQRVTAGTGKADYSPKLKLVMAELLEHDVKPLLRRALLQKYCGDFDAFDLDRIIETLDQAGALEITRTAQGPAYRLTDKILAHYRQAAS